MHGMAAAAWWTKHCDRHALTYHEGAVKEEEEDEKTLRSLKTSLSTLENNALSLLSIY